jgi:hypothetical protein
MQGGQPVEAVGADRLNVYADQGGIRIQTRQPAGTNAGDIEIIAADGPAASAGDGGQVYVQAGAVGATGGTAGAVIVISGDGLVGVDAGPVSVVGGAAEAGDGGDIQLQGGQSTTGEGGSIELVSGQGATKGNVTVRGPDGGSGPGGNVTVRGGDGGALSGAPGTLDLFGGDAFGAGIAGGEATLAGGASDQDVGGRVFVAGGPGIEGGAVEVLGGSSAAPAGIGGDVFVNAGDGDTPGDVEVIGGDSGVTKGGSATLQGGGGLLNGGDARVRGASQMNVGGIGGDVYAQAGDGDSTGGGATVSGGLGFSFGGSAALQAGVALNPGSLGGSAYVTGGGGGFRGGDATLMGGGGTDDSGTGGTALVAGGQGSTGLNSIGGAATVTGGQASLLGGTALLRGGLSTIGNGGEALVHGGDGEINGGDVELIGGDAANTTGAGGGVLIVGGNGGNGGTVQIVAGNGTLAPGGLAGAIGLDAGDAEDVGGGIQLAAGDATGAAGQGGNIEVNAGNAPAGTDGGNIILRVGNALGTVGRLIINTVASVFVWPLVDGTARQPMVTDGSGNLSFATLDSDDIENNSSVPGANVTEALDELINAAIARNWASIIANNTTGVNSMGMAAGTTGTGTQHTLATTNVYSRMAPLSEFLQAAAANVFARVTSSSAVLLADGGFDIRYLGGIADGAATGEQMAFGLAAAGAVNTGAPSASANTLLFGYDSGDTNIQLMHNDGTGTATKVDTGIPRPAANRDELYYCKLTNVPGSGEVVASILRLSNLATFTATISTDQPAAGTPLIAFETFNNAGLGGAIGLGFGFIKRLYPSDTYLD